MELVLIIISFLEFLYCLKSKIYKKSLLTIFCFLWFVIILLYSLRLFGVYDSSDGTFKMYLIGIISFFLGYIIIRPKRKPVFPAPSKKRLLLFRKGAIVVLSIISIGVFTEKAILALPLWLSGGGGDLKTAIIMDDALNTGSVADVLFVFVARPFQMIIIIYAIIVIFEKIKNRYIIWLALFLTLTVYLCTASKTTITEMVIISVAYIFLYTTLSLKSAIIRYRLLFMFISAILVILVVLLSLKDSESGPGSSFYAYLCGCMPCSDQALAQISRENHFYGLVSLNGFIRAINVFPHYLGFSPPTIKMALDLAAGYMLEFEKTINISDSIKYNAFISMFSYFYADGGYLGVALLSLLFGMLCSWSFSKSLSAPSVFSYSLSLLLVMFIMTSMVRFQLAMPFYAMALLYIIFLFPRTPLSSQRVRPRKVGNKLGEVG